MTEIETQLNLRMTELRNFTLECSKQCDNMNNESILTRETIRMYKSSLESIEERIFSINNKIVSNNSIM